MFMRSLCVLLFAAAACNVVALRMPASGGGSTAAPVASAPRSANAHTAPAQPESACPADMSVDRGARTIDAREPASIPLAKYRTLHWAPLHDTVPADDFGLAPAVAVDRVIAIEQRAPGLIPAGFRSKIAANPRDAALRVHMAACELKTTDARRRAGHDIAMAVLLHGEATPLEAMLGEVVTQGPLLSLPQGDTRCGGTDLVYEPKHHDCPNAEQRQRWHISRDEAAIEDVLTRGLWNERKRLPEHMLFYWGKLMLHACGKFQCLLEMDAGLDGRPLVHWDLRNGGHDGETVANPDADRRNKKCLVNTGFQDLGSCKWSCNHDGDCLAHCAAWCEPNPD